MSAMRQYLPVFHDVLGASVLVVGIARVAAIAGEHAGAGFSPDTPFATVSSQEDPGEPAAQSV